MAFPNRSTKDITRGQELPKRQEGRLSNLYQASTRRNKSEEIHLSLGYGSMVAVRTVCYPE